MISMSGRKNPPRVVDEDALDAHYVDAVAPHARHEVLQDVTISEAAMAGQHHLEKHILGNEDHIKIAVVDELRDRGGVLLIARRLGLLISIEVIHADHVVFEESATIGDAPLVGVIMQAWIHVTENRMAEIAAFLRNDVEDAMTMPLPSGQVDRQWHASRARCARRTAQDLLL